MGQEWGTGRPVPPWFWWVLLMLSVVLALAYAGTGGES